jgi:hypothetical protein
MQRIQIHVHEPYRKLKKLQFLMYSSVTYFTKGPVESQFDVCYTLQELFNKQLLSLEYNSGAQLT